MRLDLADNYFELFGVQPGFDIQPSRVESKYRELQSLLHPDRYVTAGAQEKRLAVQGAALVNQAYAVLLDDCARAAYLLELQGLVLNDEPDTVNDPEFLTEQMELREALEDCENAATPQDCLRGLSEDAAARLVKLSEQFKRAYAAGSLVAAREWVLKMKFVKKFHDEIGATSRRVCR